MLHNEHLFRADQTYEIRHDDKGNAIHVYIKDGEAIVFPRLADLILYLDNAFEDIERFYLTEKYLDNLYSFDEYNYYRLKKIAESISNGEIPPPPNEVHTII